MIGWGGAEAVSCLVMAAQLPWWGGCGGRGRFRVRKA